MLPEKGEYWYGSPFANPRIPPDVDPDAGEMLTVRVSKAWAPHILGALALLSRDKNWDTEDDALLTTTQYRVNDLLNLFVNPTAAPPFYDGETDVDEVTDAEYPWYEKVSDWVITAFLAVTFTPGAAIVYKTTIPQIRLAFRTGDLGAIVRVLLEDLEVWTGDTNTPAQGLLEANLDLAGFAAEHSLSGPPYEFKIVHAGAPLGVVARLGETSTYKMEVELGDIRPRAAQMEFRQNGCVFETSLDGGETWTTLFDPTTCINDAIAQGIQDAIEDGTIGGPGQPGPSTPPSAGQCKTFAGTLQPGRVWMCPSPVSTGDTVRITRKGGGWHLGDLSWYCPDGSTYVLGTCSPAGRTHDGGDLLNPGAYHMELIARVNGLYYNPTDGVVTIPGGLTGVSLELMANTSAIGPGDGAVDFEVEICSGDWLETIQGERLGTLFRKTPGGGDNGQGYGQWNAGTNEWWSADNTYGGGYYNSISIDAYGLPFNAKLVEVYYTRTYWDGTSWVHVNSNGSGQNMVSLTGESAPTPITWTGDVSANDLFIQITPISLGSMPAGTIKIWKIIVGGNGTNPFA